MNAKLTKRKMCKKSSTSSLSSTTTTTPEKPVKVTEEERMLFSEYRKMMVGRVGTVMNGWKSFDLTQNDETTAFILGLLATGDHESICRFESEVFLHGNDPTTYIRRHVIIESNEDVELSEEILKKPTVLAGEPNCGGVEGHDGCQASTSYTTRGYNGPNMEHPAIALEYLQRKHAELEKAHEHMMCQKQQRK